MPRFSSRRWILSFFLLVLLVVISHARAAEGGGEENYNNHGLRRQLDDGGDEENPGDVEEGDGTGDRGNDDGGSKPNDTAENEEENGGGGDDDGQKVSTEASDDNGNSGDEESPGDVEEGDGTGDRGNDDGGSKPNDPAENEEENGGGGDDDDGQKVSTEASGDNGNSGDEENPGDVEEGDGTGDRGNDDGGSKPNDPAENEEENGGGGDDDGQKVSTEASDDNSNNGDDDKPGEGEDSENDGGGKPSTPSPHVDNNTDTSKENPLVITDVDEGTGGTIISLVFLLAIGGFAFYCKDKVMKIVGAEMSPSAKTAKYLEVPSEDDDEEWGWGDESNDDDAGGVELAPTSLYRDDSSVHKRSRSFGEKSPTPAPKYTKSPLQPLKKTMDSSNMSSAAATNNGGLKGLSLKPSAGNAMPVATPMSTPVSAFGGTTSGMPAMQITSLGKKKAPASAKKASPPPSKEDDIFASMGLSAKPTFSHNTAPARQAAKPTATSLGNPGSRWGTISGSPAPAAVSAPIASSNFSATGSFGGDDWDDDGDLDDLLED